MRKLFDELKRRKVFRIAGVYAVVGWVLAQIAAFAVETFAAPQWVQQIFVVFLILGFPLAIILAWAYEVTPLGIKPDSLVQPSQGLPATTAQPINYIILAIVLLVAGFQIADRFVLQQQANTTIFNESTNTTSGTSSNPTRRFEINLGVTVPRFPTGISADVALSPDGKRLTIGLQRPGTPQQIYIQELDQLQPQLIRDADGGDYPFFSPDGEWIVYTAIDGRLRKISTRGGAAQPLMDSSWRSGSGFWSADDSIFYLSPGRQLMRVAATGGVPELVQVNSKAADYQQSWPWLLPDGDSLLLTAAFNARARDGQIDLLTLSTGDVRPIIQNGYNARYVPTGHIVFIRSASLWAVPFDAERLETTGPEVPVIQGVQTSGDNGAASYTFSNDGLLVYLPGEDTTEDNQGLRTLLWVDRDGNEDSLSLRRNFQRPVVSPGGQRLAVAIEENGNNDIWTYDLARNMLSRLTFDGAVDHNPLWTPDGERIVFRSEREEGGLWWRAADGTGQAEPLLTGNPNMYPSAFTPDGSQLVYELDFDLYLLNLDGESPPQQLTQTAFIERYPAISHDGHWIAYDSNETGRFEIYVRPFPDMETGKWQISIGGGQYPRWSPSDTELFFRSGTLTGVSVERTVWSALVQTDTTFQNDAPVSLFSGSYQGTGPFGAFDISTDGSQFLLIRDEGGDFLPEQTHLVAVENWFEELQRLAPPDPQ